MNTIPLTSHNELKQEFIIQFANEIENRFQNPNLQITDIAFNLGMSESELIKKVEQYVNSSPDYFLREFRLDQAIEFMRKGIPIQELSKSTGFSDQNSFNHSFMKRFNTEPSNFLASILST